MRILIPTEKTEAEYNSSVSGRCLKKLQFGVEIEDENRDFYVPKNNFEITIQDKNHIGLSLLYNIALKHHDDDIVVLMHDDVEIHDAFFVEKLKKAHEIYDIVGLAGATSQNYKNSFGGKHLWHLSSNDNRKDLRGIVAHSFGSYYNSMFFGPTPAEVAVIDGLFISVKRKALNKNDLFDEGFTFQHYDMAMCARAKQLGLKIGVWPIFVIHHGLGEFNNPVWEKSNELFKEKYINYEINI